MCVALRSYVRPLTHTPWPWPHTYNTLLITHNADTRANSGPNSGTVTVVEALAEAIKHTTALIMARNGPGTRDKRGQNVIWTLLASGLLKSTTPSPSPTLAVPAVQSGSEKELLLVLLVQPADVAGSARCSTLVDVCRAVFVGLRSVYVYV